MNISQDKQRLGFRIQSLGGMAVGRVLENANDGGGPNAGGVCAVEWCIIFRSKVILRKGIQT